MFRFYFPLFMVLSCDIYAQHLSTPAGDVFVICSTEKQPAQRLN